MRVTPPAGPDDRFRGPGAIAELRVPGLQVTESLRPPRLAERALAGADLGRTALTYLFARQTGDDPFRRSRRPDPDRGLVPRGRNQEAALTAEPGDAEARIVRAIEPPARRTYEVAARVTVGPEAPDSLLDRLAGYTGGASFASSGRFQNRPARRASSAFDGDTSTAWIGQGRSGSPPWIAWRLPRAAAYAISCSCHRGRRGGADAGAPPLGGGCHAAAGRRRAAAACGCLGRCVRARCASRCSKRGGRPAPAGCSRGRGRGRGARGRSRARADTTCRPLRSSCGIAAVAAAGRRLRLRLRGHDRASSTRAVPSWPRRAGRPLEMPAGPATVEVAKGPFRVDLLRLRSPAPEPGAASEGGGRVLDPGEAGPGSYEGVRVALDGPRLAHPRRELQRRLARARATAGRWVSPAGCGRIRERLARRPPAAATSISSSHRTAPLTRAT